MLSSVTSVLPATSFSAGRAVDAVLDDDDAAEAPAAASATSPAAPAAAIAVRPSFPDVKMMEPPLALGPASSRAGPSLVRRPRRVTKLMKVRWQSRHRKSWAPNT